MASLAGRSLVSSYKELLKLNNASLNSGISGSLQGVEDGFAGATALQISNAAVASTGTLASTGDFSVATNKLTVAAASGNTAVAGTLSATGDLAINTNKFTVAASSGNTVVAGTLNVSGTSTLASVNGTSGSFSSTLASTGDFSVATNKFNVTAASGNTAVAGTLSSAGDFSVATNKLTVAAATGNTAVAGTLSATGNLAINTNKFNVTASNGNTSVAGTLTVSDYADFSSTGAIRVPRGLDGERPAGQAGMLRFNTASQVFEGHNGVLWGSIGSGGGGGGSSQYVREKFTATSGQTSFTITGGYTPERIDVFQNGIKLVNGDDVTVTSGTSIVLTTGAVAGDVIDVVGLASGNFAGPATAKRQNFTATAGQTIFTVTGGYTPGQLDVFQNGTKLLNAVDVDVSNGSTFTLTTGANLNDTIEVVGFTAADTISGTLKFQAGTAAAPSITTFGDTNTGIFFPAADTIAFSEGGTEAMRIDSSGNVGIGTASPARGLSIYKAGATSRLIIQSDVSGQAINNGLDILLDQSNNAAVWNYQNASLFFATNNTERLRIDSNGRVGIGSTSPARQLTLDHASAPEIGLYTSGTERVKLSTGGTAASQFCVDTGGAERLRIDSSGNVGIGTTTAHKTLTVGSNDNTAYISSGGNNTHLTLASIGSSGSVIFKTGGTNGDATTTTERLRITSGGSILAGATSAQSSERLLAQNDSATNPSFIAYSPSATFAGYVTRIFADRNTSNSTYNFLSCVRVGSAGDVLIIRDSGNVVNTNNSYGAISDIKLKENIENASSQWNDIKSIQVRKFSFKNDEEHKRMLGLVAQEVELISPHLVETVIDRDKDGNDLGTTTKEVKYSVLYMKAVKALQEAMERIEQLESKVSALEAA